MKMSERDRRALILLSVTVVLVLILRFAVYRDKPAAVVAATDSIPLAEKRLARLRQIASTVSGKETLLKNVTKELTEREKGILTTETAAQAQAQILQIVRRVGKGEGIEVRGADLGAVRQLGGGYGEVQVAVSFECRIEQLVNFLAALANEQELLATNEIRVSSGDTKQKNVAVRLGLAAVVPGKLIPEKKGVTSF